jgi:hypothetical protein
MTMRNLGCLALALATLAACSSAKCGGEDYVPADVAHESGAPDTASDVLDTGAPSDLPGMDAPTDLPDEDATPDLPVGEALLDLLDAEVDTLPECSMEGGGTGIKGTIYVEQKVDPNAAVDLWFSTKQSADPCVPGPLVAQKKIGPVSSPLAYQAKLPPGTYWVSAALDEGGSLPPDSCQYYKVDGQPAAVVVQQGQVVCGVDIFLP